VWLGGWAWLIGFSVSVAGPDSLPAADRAPSSDYNQTQQINDSLPFLSVSASAAEVRGNPTEYYRQSSASLKPFTEHLSSFFVLFPLQPRCGATPRSTTAGRGRAAAWERAFASALCAPRRSGTTTRARPMCGCPTESASEGNTALQAGFAHRHAAQCYMPRLQQATSLGAASLAALWRIAAGRNAQHGSPFPHNVPDCSYEKSSAAQPTLLCRCSRVRPLAATPARRSHPSALLLCRNSCYPSAVLFFCNSMHRQHCS